MYYVLQNSVRAGLGTWPGRLYLVEMGCVFFLAYHIV